MAGGYCLGRAGEHACTSWSQVSCAPGERRARRRSPGARPVPPAHARARRRGWPSTTRAARARTVALRRRRRVNRQGGGSGGRVLLNARPSARARSSSRTRAWVADALTAARGDRDAGLPRPVRGAVLRPGDEVGDPQGRVAVHRSAGLDRALQRGSATRRLPAGCASITRFLDRRRPAARRGRGQDDRRRGDGGVRRPARRLSKPRWRCGAIVGGCNRDGRRRGSSSSACNRARASP